MVVCLLLSGSLHLGVAVYEWSDQPSRAKSSGSPLVVTLETVTVAEESKASQPQPSQSSAPQPTPKQVVAQKPKVQKTAEPTRPQPPEKIVRKPVERAPEATPVCETESPLPGQERFDLISRLQSVHNAVSDQKPALPTTYRTDSAGKSQLSAVKGQVETVASGKDAESDARPMYWDNPLPDYPLQARRRHWEGVVWLSVEVSSAGEVETLALDKSSGYSVLDRSALKTVRNWKFLPARRAGIPVSCQVRVPVRFLLDES